MTAGELVRIDFHGDTLDTLQDADGGWASLRRLCENLGVKMQGQLAKLKAEPCIRIKEIVTQVHGDDQDRRQVFIEVRSIPYWLATIKRGKVRPEVRGKLDIYKREVVEVLAAHFLGRPAPPPAPPIRPWAIRWNESFGPHHRLVVNSFPPGSFTVVTASVTHLLMLEEVLVRHLFPVGPSDRPCGSIGLCWGNHRRSELGRSDNIGHAPLHLPGRPEPVDTIVYAADEYPAFCGWFNADYLPGKLGAYLRNKPEFNAVAGRLGLASAHDHACQALVGRPARLADRIRDDLAAVGGFVPAGPDPVRIPAARRGRRSLLDALEE